MPCRTVVSHVDARRLVRLGGALLLSVALAACAPRPTAERAPPHPDARVVPIHVAMLRPLTDPGVKFGQERPEELNYFRARISVPPTHKPGQIEWPEGQPDPATDFVVAETKVYAGPDAMKRQMRRQAPGRPALVYIHGYNNSLSEAMYRLAQMQADFDTDLAPVLFSWPSAGDPRGYIYDRDSVLYARDYLERVLLQLTADPGERVFLVAHSMGAHLLMEALRQAALSGDRRLLSRVAGVVLMSPDIDPDLFRKQAEVIGDLPEPFMIFVSRRDQILNLAGLLTGRKPRLGIIDNPEQLRGLDVTLVDFTNLSDGERYSHFVPVTSPAAISVLRGMIDQAGLRGSDFADFMRIPANP
jgi:esterase/lipase superfamily enzyme